MLGKSYTFNVSKYVGFKQKNHEKIITHGMKVQSTQ